MEHPTLLRSVLSRDLAAIDYEGRATLAVSATIAGLPGVADAIARGDRAALGALLGNSMTALKAQGIPLITFQVPPAISLYRGHSPQSYGDDVSGRRNLAGLRNAA